jgi:hypothetical protein
MGHACARLGLNSDTSNRGRRFVISSGVCHETTANVNNAADLRMTLELGNM